MHYLSATHQCVNLNMTQANALAYYCIISYSTEIIGCAKSNAKMTKHIFKSFLKNISFVNMPIWILFV